MFLSRQILAIILYACVFFPSCTVSVLPEIPDGGKETASFRFRLSGPVSKSADPDENRISDMNIFVFNTYGVLEASAYMTWEDSGSDAGMIRWTANLVRNASYSVYACANFGYRMTAGSAAELEEMKYYMAYPDDYAAGIPMSGYVGNVIVTGNEITVPLERLMAKISLTVDRSRLDDDVEFNIRSIQVEGCPRSVNPFRRNHIRDPFDFFPSGFIKKDYEADMLNTEGSDGNSGEVSLYMLENMQGDLLPGNTDEAGKVLPDGNPGRELCSYIEIKAEYMSGSVYSRPGEYLIYRFYPGENPGNFDVCRNSEYRIRITPVGSGLEGLEWRIDKSGMEYLARTLELSYTELQLTYSGETVQVQPYITPESSAGMLVWYSDDESVATVSGDGTVKANGEGKCKIVCYAADGSGCSAECDITVDFLPYYMKIFPGNFIRCRKGDVLEFTCDYFPQNAPFDVGLEELEYDKNRGIYDYSVSDDGKTVTLYTKSRGTGLLYMETGYPINQAELIIIVIE